MALGCGTRLRMVESVSPPAVLTTAKNAPGISGARVDFYLLEVPSISIAVVARLADGPPQRDLDIFRITPFLAARLRGTAPGLLPHLDYVVQRHCISLLASASEMKNNYLRRVRRLPWLLAAGGFKA